MDVSMTALIGFVDACFLAATTAAAFRVGDSVVQKGA
jgi:hypothetical protein